MKAAGKLPALLLGDEDFKTGLRNWWHSQVNTDYRRVQQPVFLTAAPVGRPCGAGTALVRLEVITRHLTPAGAATCNVPTAYL